GVLSGIPDADGVMADLGGGSIELVRLERAAAPRGAVESPGPAPGRRLYIVDEAVRQGEKLRSLVGRRFPAVPWLAGIAQEQGSGAAEHAAGVDRDMMATLPLGPLRVVEEAQRRGEKLRALVERHLASVPWLKDAARGRAFYPVGGAWRNLAKIHIQQSRYPLQVIQGYTISAGEARNLARLIAAMSKASVASLKGVSRRRAEVLPIAALVLDCVLEATAAKEVVFSAQGLREGFLFSQLPPDVAASDPLLALCREMDARESRFGSVGENLSKWTAGLFPRESDANARLRRAACHLSDAFWRAHPDYRADLAFRQVLLGPFTGITHAERAFLALTIHARYGGMSDDEAVEPALRLVADTAADRARFLGAALRLGFAYCGANTQLLPPTTLTAEPGILRFAVPAGAHAQLAAGLVERRLDSAAKAGRLKPDLRIEA
ncbi:MAG: hypothetical protein JNK11_19830, partial [Alphaproteobacteria bacterium]|nr:hypothetical protein [Alphaproteobacteria bacterium]